MGVTTWPGAKKMFFIGFEKFILILHRPVFVVMITITPPYLGNLEISVENTTKVNKRNEIRRLRKRFSK